MINRRLKTGISTVTTIISLLIACVYTPQYVYAEEDTYAENLVSVEDNAISEDFESAEEDMSSENLINAEEYAVDDELIVTEEENESLEAIEIVQATTTVNQNGFTFVLRDGYYEVTDYTGSDTTVNIPSTINGLDVRVIGENFLYHKTASSKVQSIVIPVTVTRIETNAFRECTQLRNISWGTYTTRDSFFLPDYVKMGVGVICDYAFYGDTALNTIDLSIPGVRSIGAYAFGECKNVSTLKLPRTLSEIGANAFANCTGLQTMYFYGKVNDWLNISYGDSTKETHPNYYAKTNYCSTAYDAGWGQITYTPEAISTITIDSTITSVSDYAFYNFSSIQKVTINGPGYVGSYAFGNCTSLSSLEVHNTVSVFGSNVVSGCTSLGIVKVHQGATADNIFTSQKGVGNTHYSISYMADDGCAEVYAGGELPPVIDDDDEEPSINVPTGDNFVNDNTYKIDGYSGEFDGSLKFNIYCSFDYEIRTDSGAVVHIRVSDGGDNFKEYEYNISKMSKSSKGFYVFQVELLPKEVDSEIAFQLELGDGRKGKIKTTSYYNYLVRLVQKANLNYGKIYNEVGELAMAILTYCDASQKYFKYHVGSIDENYLLIDYFATAPVSEIKKDDQFNIRTEDYIGCTITLEGTLSLSLYYAGDKNIAALANYKQPDTVGFTMYTFDGFVFGQDSSSLNSLSHKYAYMDQNAVQSFSSIYSYLCLAYSKGSDELKYVVSSIYLLDQMSSYYLSDITGHVPDVYNN